MDARHDLALTDIYLPTSIEFQAQTTVQPFAQSMEMTMHAVEDTLLEAEPASPAPSSSSSRDKWQQKRHVCDMPDCSKSFDSKWALIRFGFSDNGADSDYKLTRGCLLPL